MGGADRTCFTSLLDMEFDVAVRRRLGRLLALGGGDGDTGTEDLDSRVDVLLSKDLPELSLSSDVQPHHQDCNLSFPLAVF